MGVPPAKLHEKLPLRRRCPPGTDEAAMDFRRLLPEIRWQSRLSPVSRTRSPDWFFDPLTGEPRSPGKLKHAPPMRCRRLEMAKLRGLRRWMPVCADRKSPDAGDSFLTFRPDAPK